MEEKKQRRNQKTKSVGNGNGSFYKSKVLGRYVFQYFDPTGKRKTLTQRKKETITDFRKKVTYIRSNLDNGSYISRSNETFLEILRKYVEQKHKDGITSDRSYSRELSTIKEISNVCSNFINKPIQKIVVEDIEESKENMRKYSNAVISKIWIYISKTFQIATSRRKIPFNIMLDEVLTKPISKRPEKKVEALTVEEQNKLVDILNNEQCNHKYRDIVLLQLYTGMRIGEVLALSTDCIDLTKNTLTVYRTLTKDDKFNIIMGEHTKTYKKTSGIDKGKRTFPMHTKVRSLIEKILSSYSTNDYGLLFWNKKKQSYISPSNINNYLKKLNNDYKITKDNLHSHRLRHTFITRCVENDINISVLQSLVGHVKGSSITSDIYTSVSADFMIKELKKIQ